MYFYSSFESYAFQSYMIENITESWEKQVISVAVLTAVWQVL